MNRFTKTFLSAFLFSSLVAGAVFAKAPTTEISGDSDPLKDDSIAICAPLTKGKGFITGTLGKMLNIPKTVKIDDIGFLMNALSVEAIQATFGNPKGFTVTEVLPYLKKSKEMEDSLKLRRTARQIKFQTVQTMLKKVDKLTEDQKKAIVNFLSQQVGAPLIVLEKSPLPSFMPTPGPCMIPIGIEVVDGKSERRVGLETSAICVLDIEANGEKLFSVQDSLNNDTLDIVLCHENGHAIMFDMYGKAFAAIQRISTNGHDAPYITDLGLGYIEGWAEAFEAVYGPANPKLKEKDRKKYNISEFLFGRQDPIRRDRYIWAKYMGQKTGVLKNGLQLMCTEGVVAGQLYDILTNRAITGAFEKSVTTMLMLQPSNYPEFIAGFVKLFPDDKKVMYRIVLEGMNYVPMSNDAAKLYHAYYQAKLAFVQKKGEKEALNKAKEAFTSFKEDLFKKAMDGANIFANVGPEMWFSGVLNAEKKGVPEVKTLVAKAFGQDKNAMPFNLDLNTVTAKMLVAIGFASEDADRVIQARQEKGFFTGNPLSTLKSLVGNEKFAAVQEKSQLKPYQPKQAAVADNQAKALWPEDLEKCTVAE